MTRETEKDSQSASKLAQVSTTGHPSVRKDEEQSQKQDACAVSDVAEHDAVQEGEGRRREEGRVGLFVPRHAVGIDEFLRDTMG